MISKGVNFNILFILFQLIVLTAGHGMVLDPVGRGSIWRYRYGAAIDYNDNQGFCGGFYAQYYENNGKCGYCGDPYSDVTPRPHEHGGRYGRGVITATYVSGGKLPVAVKITANHMGYFKFQLCNMDVSGGRETDACFNANKLKLLDGSDRYVWTENRVGWFNLTLQIPNTLSCNHCVLQWTYTTGNSWGVCDNGGSAVGCGAQEIFRTCSDIQITGGSRIAAVESIVYLANLPMRIKSIETNSLEIEDIPVDLEEAISK